MALILHNFVLFSLLFTAVCLGLVIPGEAKKDRVLDTKEHEPDVDHFKENEHNAEYDHEAFLGRDEAKEFDNLTPEESKQRLRKIVHRIDVNNDGFVDFEELKNWIHKSQRGYILDDVDRQWSTHNPDNKEKISWQDFQKVTYGFMEELDESTSAEDKQTYKEMIRRDKRRWDRADKDADGKLNKDEFTDFLHPEESEHMRDVVVEETLEDVDKNKDGKVSADEYISDMYAPDAGENEVPDWVLREKQQFTEHRDKNKDGFMDKEEIKEWIMPANYDHSGSEARHLIHEADVNKDDKLSEEEIIDSYDLFVGSQATDFGDALMQHDEF